MTSLPSPFAPAPMIALRILTARLTQGLTQTDLAARSGLDQKQISRIERAEASSMSLADFTACAAALRISLDDLACADELQFLQAANRVAGGSPLPTPPAAAETVTMRQLIKLPAGRIVVLIGPGARDELTCELDDLGVPWGTDPDTVARRELEALLTSTASLQLTTGRLLPREWDTRLAPLRSCGAPAFISCPHDTGAKTRRVSGELTAHADVTVRVSDDGEITVIKDRHGDLTAPQAGPVIRDNGNLRRLAALPAGRVAVLIGAQTSDAVAAALRDAGRPFTTSHSAAFGSQAGTPLLTCTETLGVSAATGMSAQSWQQLIEGLRLPSAPTFVRAPFVHDLTSHRGSNHMIAAADVVVGCRDGEIVIIKDRHGDLTVTAPDVWEVMLAGGLVCDALTYVAGDEALALLQAGLARHGRMRLRVLSEQDALDELDGNGTDGALPGLDKPVIVHTPLQGPGEQRGSSRICERADLVVVARDGELHIVKNRRGPVA